MLSKYTLWLHFTVADQGATQIATTTEAPPAHINTESVPETTPAHSAPTTEAPTTQAPVTSTKAPTTQAPVPSTTEKPTTLAPVTSTTTEVPTSQAPVTSTTEKPVTTTVRPSPSPSPTTKGLSGVQIALIVIGAIMIAAGVVALILHFRGRTVNSYLQTI